MPLRVAQPIPVPMAAATPPRMLPVQFVKQEQDNWCWAACSEMLFGLLGFTVNGTVLHQCDLASAQFHGNCCAAPGSSVCNQGCWPENVYNFYGINYSRVEYPLPTSGVQTEINGGRPVEVYLAWSGGTAAHVVLIVGYYDDGELEIYDPYDGPSRHPYSDVVKAFNKGAWTISYLGLRR
jgi:Papain-like cysteine protease AvrRpt2